MTDCPVWFIFLIHSVINGVFSLVIYAIQREFLYEYPIYEIPEIGEGGARHWRAVRDVRADFKSRGVRTVKAIIRPDGLTQVPDGIARYCFLFICIALTVYLYLLCIPIPFRNHYFPLTYITVDFNDIKPEIMWYQTEQFLFFTRVVTRLLFVLNLLAMFELLRRRINGFWRGRIGNLFAP